MKEIAPGVFIETDYSLVTVGAILTREGWVCIDTPLYPRDARSWRAALQALSDLPVRFVINTDHHRDRILGNTWFEAPVVTHAACAEVVSSLKTVFISQTAEELSNNDTELFEIASLKIVPPQISYTDTMTLHCGDRAITLSHKPSATAGNTWVILAPEKLIFAGDAIVTAQHPYVVDGCSEPWLKSLRILRLDRYDGWTVVSGREGIVPIAATGQLSEYLRVARRRINSLLRANHPRSELAALIPEFLPFFPYPPERRDEIQRRIKIMLEAVYEEMRTSQAENVDAE
jgi:cyclase